MIDRQKYYQAVVAIRGGTYLHTRLGKSPFLCCYNLKRFRLLMKLSKNLVRIITVLLKGQCKLP